MKRYGKGWEKIFVNYISDRRFVSRVIKNSQNPIIKRKIIFKSSNVLNKYQKDREKVPVEENSVNLHKE